MNYLLCFQKDTAGVKVFVDSSNKVNGMTPAYAAKLGLKVQKTNIEAQKINGSTFEIFEMVLADF